MRSPGQKPFYLHIVGEISEIKPETLVFSDIDAKFRKVLDSHNIKVVKNDFHEFSGGGLSIIYILSASHLAIHTWPEFGFLHFDLITCMPETDFEVLKVEIEKAYPKSKVEMLKLDY